MRSSCPEPARPSCYPAVPPVPQAEETVECVALLRELPGATGALLWGALRDLMLWIDARVGEHGAVFAPDAARVRTELIRTHPLPDDLATPTITFALLAGEAELARPDRLRYACCRVAEWAAENAAPETRLAFVQAAARLAPWDSSLALEAGRLARDLGHSSQAETWLRRSVKLSRNQDWETYVWGYMALGHMYWRAGNHPAALAVAQRALRKALRHRLRELRPVVLHNLFMFVSDRDVRQAYQYAWQALRAYGPGHLRLPILAQDLASFWMDHGHYARALRVVEAVVPRLTDPTERALVVAGLSRAAAGAGRKDVYEAARTEALRILAEGAAESRKSETLVTLARADALAHEWSRAVEIATKATEISTARGEHWIRMAAEAVLAAAGTEEPFVERPRAVEATGLARQADQLQADLIRWLDGEPHQRSAGRK